MNTNTHSSLDIYDCTTDSTGWLPIKHMIRLMAEISDSKLILQNRSAMGLKDKLNVYFVNPRKKNAFSNENALVILATPTFDRNLITILKQGYNKVAVWVIDSFWTNLLSTLYSEKIFDHLFITSGCDIEFYKAKTKIPTSFLGWGSDVLGLGGLNNNRKIDILRIGRQPAFFDNDDENGIFFESVGVKFQGRPPQVSYTDLLHKYFMQAKYVLAHTNLCDASRHTHKEKEYITARWTDALACGCIVLGKQPTRDYAYQQYIWPEAVFDIEIPDCREQFIEDFKSKAIWDPEIGAYNYSMALRNLDWRWRFKIIFDEFGINCDKLNSDLIKIQSTLAKF